MGNTLFEQVLSVPSMIDETFWACESQARQILPTEEIFSTEKVIMFGSGDSFHAATGAVEAFMQLGGFDTTAFPALYASRYFAPNCAYEPKKNILAIGISNSGEAARTVEAMLAFSKAGFRTLAITGKPESRMAMAAQRVLHVETPSFASAPGVRAYVTTQLTLYLLAIRFGEVKGLYTMDRAGNMRRELAGLSEVLRCAYRNFRCELDDFAFSCTKHRNLELLGAGPCRASADFGMSKLIEAYGFSATSQDVEEFAHLNFFRIKPQEIPTILVAPSGSRSLGRTLEVAKALKALERPHIVLTDEKDHFTEQGNHTVCVQQALDEMFAPVVYSCLVAHIVAQIDGGDGNEYFRGHKGAWAETDFPGVRSSKIQY